MMRARAWFGVAVAIIIVLVPFPMDGATYRRSVSLDPLRLSYGELSPILRRGRALVLSANTGHQTTLRPTETLELQGRNLTVTLPGPIAPEELSKAPPVIYSLSYTYQHYDAPVSRVSLELSDFRRLLVVEGSSPEQVEAVSKVLAGDLAAHTSWLGTWYAQLGCLLLISAIIGWFIRSWPTPQFVFALAVCQAILFWLLSRSDWFSGFVGYAGDASILVRHAPEISLVGLVATVVLGTAAIIQAHYLAKRRSPAVSEPPRDEAPG